MPFQNLRKVEMSLHATMDPDTRLTASFKQAAFSGNALESVAVKGRLQDQALG